MKSPYDGKKRVKTARSSYKDRVQAIHIDCLGSQRELIGKHLKAILKSASFSRRYAVDVRLVPLINRDDSPYTQDKIRKCIVQHGQFCKCVDSMAVSGIDHLDQRNAKLKRTLRELIVGLSEAHFLNIDLNWRRDSFSILFPKKYEDIARDRIANLGAYLHKAYGDAILPSLPAETQELISTLEWDEKTGRPISALDRELDDIITHGNEIEFVDLSILEEDKVATRPSIAEPSQSFTPKLDQTSVSTFGTIKATPNTSPDKTSKSSPWTGDSESVVSSMTMETIDSRISRMESGFNSINTLLEKLVSQNKPSDGPATPATNNGNTAGSSKDAAETA